MPAASEPKSGSVVASEVSGGRGPSQSGVRQRRCCSALPSASTGPAKNPRRRDERAEAAVAVAQLLLDHALGEALVHAAAAELLRQHVGGQADLGRLLPQLPGHAAVVRLVDLGGDRTDLARGERRGRAPAARADRRRARG